MRGEHPSEFAEIDIAVRPEDQRAAIEKRAPDFESRRIEGWRRHLEKNFIAAERRIIRFANEAHDIAMRDKHTLRRAGGAGGEHDIGGAVGRWSCGIRTMTSIPAILADDEVELRLLDQELSPAGRVVGVERHIDSAPLQRAEHRGDHLRRPLQRQADA